MALPPLVSLEDFAIRVGGISDADEARAEAVLIDASALIRSEAGDEDWADASGGLEEVPDVIVTLVIAVAIRAFRNPDGYRQESIGTYSVTYGDSSSSVFLTAAERRIIRRATGQGAMSSIGLEGEWALSDTEGVLVPVEGGGDDFPLGVPEGELGWRLSGSN